MCFVVPCFRACPADPWAKLPVARGRTGNSRCRRSSRTNSHSSSAKSVSSNLRDRPGIGFVSSPASPRRRYIKTLRAHCQSVCPVSNVRSRPISRWHLAQDRRETPHRRDDQGDVRRPMQGRSATPCQAMTAPCSVKKCSCSQSKPSSIDCPAVSACGPGRRATNGFCSALDATAAGRK